MILPSIYMKAIGVILTVQDRRSRRVRNILRHMRRMPVRVWRALRNAGMTHVWVTNKPVPKMDNMGYLSGQAPRNWPPGATWDSVPGTYDPGSRQLLIGGGEHGSVSLALHETGHAINFLLGYRDSPELVEHHVRLFHKLDEYERQEGPGGLAGRDEMFAESIAWLLMFGDKRVSAKYDPQYMRWLKGIIKHPVAVAPPLRLKLDEYVPGLCRTGPVDIPNIRL